MKTQGIFILWTLLLSLLFTSTSMASQGECQAHATDSISESWIELCEYKKNIENEAYKVVLKLCMIHKRTRNQHILDEEYERLRPYVGSSANRSAIIRASNWESIKFSVEGLMTFPSSMFGSKATWSEAHDFGFLDTESWFQSTYTQYLVHSEGFHEAATDCLGSEEEIASFKEAVLAKDYLLSVIGQVGGFFIPIVGLSRLIGWIAKTTPIQWIKNIWGRMNSVQKTALVLGSLGALTNHIYSKKKKHNESEKQSQQQMEIELLNLGLSNIYNKVYRSSILKGTPRFTESDLLFFKGQLESLEEKNKLSEKELFYKKRVLEVLNSVTSNRTKILNILEQPEWMFIRYEMLNRLSFALETENFKYIGYILTSLDIDLMKQDFKMLQSNLNKSSLAPEEAKGYISLLENTLPTLESFPFESYYKTGAGLENF